MQKLEKLLDKLLDTKISLAAFSGGFMAIIFLRMFTEQFMARSLQISDYQIVIEYIHNLYFFLITFVLIWLFLSLYLKINPVRFSWLFLWASLLILFPPLLDMVRTKGEVFWSFYMIASARDLGLQFITVFGNFPSGIVYFGTRIVFLSAILMCAGIVYLKTRNWIKTAIGTLTIYIILFFMGGFPTIYFFLQDFLTGKEKISDIKAYEIARFFGAPQKIFGLKSMDFMYSFPYNVELLYYPILILLLSALFFLISKDKFISVLKNFRYPQLIYHGGLLFLGIGLGYLQYRDNFAINIFSLSAISILLISVSLAWKASVVINDIYDLEIDKISNPGRPLPKGIFNISEYAQFGIVCFLLSLLGGITVGFNFFILLLAYQIIAWFYSALPFRLKKFPVVATFVSALASLMILFLGYILMSSDQTIYTLSWRIILLLLITYTISIPIKDLKDIEGDKKYGIWTIPVIFGEKNGRLIIAISHFCSYIMSVFFLNEMKLFFWAVIFGAINYTIIISKKIDPRRIFWWVLGAVSIYLLIMIKIVFVDNMNSLIK
jgi:4-hydroxybenzoate polyprenyltransferase